MAQLTSDKYNIAWFKLAEFVVRREKERAMGMYRLLVHSLPDDAFAAQLEGDLLFAFQDEKAINAYVKAAARYERDGKLMQAAAVYENLMHIAPQHDYFFKLLNLYSLLVNEAKLEYCAKDFLTSALREKSEEKIKEIVYDTLDILLQTIPHRVNAFLAHLEMIDPQKAGYARDYLTKNA